MSGAPAPAAEKSAAHASLMDGMYRYQRHVYDATRKYYLLGRDRTIRGLAVPPGGTLLEIGCGTGRNLTLAHAHFPKARFFGLDISEEMLLSARKALARRSIEAELSLADATRFAASDFGEAGFDRILISYALSMIPDWQGAVDAALSALKPGGELHVVDFGQQEGLPPLFRLLLQFWLTRFHVTPRADLKAVLSARAEALGAELRFEGIGGGYAWRAVIRLSA